FPGNKFQDFTLTFRQKFSFVGFVHTLNQAFAHIAAQEHLAGKYVIYRLYKFFVRIVFQNEPVDTTAEYFLDQVHLIVHAEHNYLKLGKSAFCSMNQRQSVHIREIKICYEQITSPERKNRSASSAE